MPRDPGYDEPLHGQKGAGGGCMLVFTVWLIIGLVYGIVRLCEVVF